MGTNQPLVVTERQAALATNLAERLKLAMRARGIKSGSELGRIVGVQRQTAYYWLDGTTKNIESTTLVRLAEALGVRHQWLIDGELPVYAMVVATEEEQQIIGFFRRMSPSDQIVFMKMARGLAGDSSAPATRDDPYPNVRRA